MPGRHEGCSNNKRYKQPQIKLICMDKVKGGLILARTWMVHHVWISQSLCSISLCALSKSVERDVCIRYIWPNILSLAKEDIFLYIWIVIFLLFGNLCFWKIKIMQWIRVHMFWDKVSILSYNKNRIKDFCSYLIHGKLWTNSPGVARAWYSWWTYCKSA